MRNENQIYEVEIKSQAILRDGKKSFITYFQGGTVRQVAKNVKLMYPQFTESKDKPMVNITKITNEEYNERCVTGIIKQKGHRIDVGVNMNEIMGN